MKDEMGYERLAQEALRGVIRLALQRVAEEGALPGDHRIYVKFRTNVAGVILPDRLRAQYPDDITIVLKQHFWDLVVEDDKFSVGLSFDQRPELLTVPYRAVVQFFDPSVSFIMHFPEPPTPVEVPASTDAEIVSLDAFRKKGI